MMRPPLGLQHDLKGHSPKPNNAPLSPSGRGLDTKNPNRRPPLQHPPGQFPPYVSVFLVSALILGFDTGIKASMKWTEREKQLALLENESVQNQLAFLKNQISPHFFMNTLNNIHALIDIDTEEAKESIIKLSKLMRYLLYESEEGKVPLVKEFEFINSYVNLMKLRFSEKVKIDLNFSEKIPDKLIPPMLFTSLIENAFKHGISYKEESFIQIDFLTTESRIVFEIRNKKTETANDSKHSGIGIENTKKRLDLLYGNNYQMDIIENNDDFMVNLTIPII
ncbi:MAG: histidine kinase [Salinivirgaceae bacterium]|nr:histidine kinase [Salinivirgaceae bacterium]